MSNHQHSEASHLTSRGTRPLKISLALILSIMAVEVIGGILSNSLALLSDAGHMLVDALALGLSLLAMTIARKPATLSKTYGYHRVEIMAALTNGIILALLSLFIFYEAYQRLLEPPVIRTPIMLLVASIGLGVNLAGMMLLRKWSHRSLNIKAAFWHIIGDTVSSVGVIVAGIIIAFTGWYVLDAIVSFFIGGIIMWGAVQIVREASDILLEAVPKHIELSEVIKTIGKVPGVEEVHDIHIWTITSGVHALSAHLIIGDQLVSRSGEVVAAVNENLARNFGITHTTLQIECQACESCPSGFICNLRRPGE